MISCARKTGAALLVAVSAERGADNGVVLCALDPTATLSIVVSVVVPYGCLVFYSDATTRLGIGDVVICALVCRSRHLPSGP